MTKVSKLLLTLVLAGVMLVAGAASALAFDEVEPLAAWANDGTGTYTQ